MALAAYGLATRCPALTWRMTVLVAYAPYAMSGTEVAYGVTSRDLYCPAGTEDGMEDMLEGGRKSIILRICYDESRTDTGYYAAPLLRDVRYSHQLVSSSFATRCPVPTWTLRLHYCSTTLQY
eukprot:3940724-Rhodomonas_salina.2